LPKLTILPYGRTVEVSRETRVLDALEDLGYDVPFHCRAGRCGADPIRVIGAEDAVSAVEGGEALGIGVNERDGNPGCRMSCSTRVLGDVTVDVSLILPSVCDAA